MAGAQSHSTQATPAGQGTSASFQHPPSVGNTLVNGAPVAGMTGPTLKLFIHSWPPAERKASGWAPTGTARVVEAREVLVSLLFSQESAENKPSVILAEKHYYWRILDSMPAETKAAIAKNEAETRASLADFLKELAAVTGPSEGSEQGGSAPSSDDEVDASESPDVVIEQAALVFVDAAGEALTAARNAAAAERAARAASRQKRSGAKAQQGTAEGRHRAAPTPGVPQQRASKRPAAKSSPQSPEAAPASETEEEFVESELPAYGDAFRQDATDWELALWEMVSVKISFI